MSALGHDWGAPSYTWTENCDAVTAARVCRRDPGHVETETAAASFTVTRPADTEHEGEITFTATFRNPAFGTQTRVIKTQKLDPEDPHPNPFIDVKRDEYYYDSILWAYYHMPQITTGADEIHYQPEEGCTRAQVVTFLWRAAGKPSVEGADNPFRDVAKGEYYYDAVLWALREGVTTGTDPDRFSPEETCTRAQIVTFLWRYEKKPAPASADNPFRDVPAGEYYTDAVLWAVSKGVTKGTDPDRFSPEETCTRAQIVTFLYRDLG